MSVDIVILKFERDMSSLGDVGEEDAQMLGDAAAVRQAVDTAFPGFEWNAVGDGLLVVREAYALEITIPAGPNVLSLHMSVKLGVTWEIDGDDEFHDRLAGLCRSNGWQAFAVSDNSRVD
jgi:hypothetical protein